MVPVGHLATRSGLCSSSWVSATSISFSNIHPVSLLRRVLIASVVRSDRHESLQTKDSELGARPPSLILQYHRTVPSYLVSSSCVESHSTIHDAASAFVCVFELCIVSRPPFKGTSDLGARQRQSSREGRGTGRGEERRRPHSPSDGRTDCGGSIPPFHHSTSADHEVVHTPTPNHQLDADVRCAASGRHTAYSIQHTAYATQTKAKAKANERAKAKANEKANELTGRRPHAELR
jgi:hypothetical protein